MKASLLLITLLALTTIIAGIEWAVDNGADIISLSLGAPLGEMDIPLNNALQDAIDKGVVVVVASGNYGPCAGKSSRSW